MAVDFNEFVLPYKCDVGSCTFSCFVPSDFIDHLNKEHQQCDKFCCYICAHQDNGKGFIALQPSLMIKHFILHNINVYQCIFCLFGSEFIESMICHLSMEHFEYKPLCLKRSVKPGYCDSSKIENLEIVEVKRPINNGLLEIVNLPFLMSSLLEDVPKKPKRRRIEPRPDVISTAMKDIDFEESTQSSDTIVITVPDSAKMIDSSNSLVSVIDNEFIMLDDVDQNDLRETLRINDIWTENESNEVELPQQLDSDVITIDDEDESSNEPTKEISNKRKHSVDNLIDESIDGPNKSKRLAFPLIDLNKLYFCKECDQGFSTSNDYQTHLTLCPNWNLNERKRCTFCTRSFKTAFNLIEHVKLHGPDRFLCHLCNFNVPSRRAIEHHMKVRHSIIHLDFVPAHVKLTDLEKDKFIVYEDKTHQAQKTFKGSIGFKCGECALISVERRTLIVHMKNIHNIDKYEIRLVHSPLNNDYKELYEISKVNSSIDLQSPDKRITTKRKRHDNYSNKNVEKTDTAKPKVIAEDKKALSFSPDSIDSIPMMHIFSTPIGCSLCTYSTKVRSNLILHLDGHKKGQDNTTKEIVNPVPSIGKSELMFDKMINLSASSFEAMNSEKMKIDELNLKIIEVSPVDDLNTELFPRFIPKNKRFQCSEKICNQQFFLDVDLLKTHMSIIHKDFQFYLCPHCPSNSIQTKEVEINNIELHLMYHTENLYKCQYCDYIDFNKDKMRRHMRTSHLPLIIRENQSNIIVIRQSKLEDYSIDRVIIQAQLPVVAQWICNLCPSSNNIKYTENEIMSHLFLAHKASKMYRCPMCSYERDDNDAQKFEDHFKLSHPNVAYKCQKVCDKITDAEQLAIQSKNLVGKVENNQEQQALESIEPLVLPTCRGIPIESIYSNKSRSVSKSPKSSKKPSVKARKQKIVKDDFKEDDSLGTISSKGQFVCPKCNAFETTNIENFRDHLYKDIIYKKWKCLNCFEISDSPKKMAWHIKKHGVGAKYEKIEDIAKLQWVERVIKHQQNLFIEFSKQNEEENVIIVQQTIADKNKSPSKSKKITSREKKVINPQMSGEIINLLDDSDDE